MPDEHCEIHDQMTRSNPNPNLYLFPTITCQLWANSQQQVFLMGIIYWRAVARHKSLFNRIH